MPNYTLGVAHGSIKITSDNAGATQTLAALKALRDAQGDYDKALRNSGSSSRSSEKAARAMADASDNLAKRSRALEAALLPLAAAGRAASSGLERVADSAIPAAKKIIEIQKAVKGASNQLNELTSAVGLTRAAFAQLNDYEQTLAWLVDMAKKISEGASKFLGFAAAGNAAVKALQKVAASGAAVTMFGKLAAAAAKVRWSFIGAGLAATQVGQRASILLPVLQRVGAMFGLITGPIGVLAAASPRLQRALIGLSSATGVMSSRLGAASPAVRRLGSALQANGPVALRFYNSLIKVASGITSISLGTALLSRGLKGFGAIVKKSIFGVAGLSLAAATVVPVMKVLGTTVKGAWDGLKQLSGAALILPGALTAIGIAAGTAKIAFKGITDAFKAGALEGEEFDAALKAMSPKMQEVARAAKELYPAIEQLRDNVQSTALNGFTESMGQLAQTYLPVLNTGLTKTAEGLRSIIQGFVGFAQQPETIRDVASALDITSTMMQRVGQSVQPVLSALRDIGTVGLEAIRDMTGNMSTAAANFGTFIAMARGNGDLRRWIDEGIQGFRDLGSTISSITSAVGGLFGAFGADGDNGLARLAAGAQKLEESMTRLGESDGMGKLVDGLSRVSSSVFEALSVGASELGDVLVTLGPYAERVSNAFSQRMAQVFQSVGTAMNYVANALNSIAGSADVVGYLLGTAAALGIIKIALIPIIRGLQTMAGSFAIVTGAAKLFQGTAGAASAGLEMMGKSAVVAGVKLGLLGTALARVGAAAAVAGAQAKIMSRIAQTMVTTYAIGARAANVYAGGLTNLARAALVARAGLAGLGVAAKGALAALGGPVGAALIALTVGMMAFSSASSSVKAANEAMANSAQHAKEGITGLIGAFAKSGGVMDAGVFEEMSAQIGVFRDDLEATAATTTGTMADIGASLKDAFNWDAIMGRGGNAEANKKIDEVAAAAQKAAAAFDELGMSNEQIAQSISGSDADYAAFSKTLAGMGENGAAALDAIASKRDTFVQIRDSMAGASDGAVQMGEALRVLGDAGASAADQLDAVKSALQAMGLMTLNSQEAFAQYQEGLAEFGNAASIAVDGAAALGSAMLNTDGSLNLVNANSRDLRDSIIGLADGMIQSVNAGQNADEAWSQMQGSLQNLATAYQLPLPAIQALAASAGAVPDVLNMLVSLKGAPEATQQLVNLGVELNQVPAGTTVNVKVNDEGVLAAIRAVGGAVGEVDAMTGQVDITAPNQGVLDAINAIVAAAQQPMNGSVNIDSNAPAVRGTVDQIKASLLAIPPQTLGSITINGAETAANNAQQIAESLSKIVGSVNATVTAPGLPDVALDSDTARQALAGLQGTTTVTVTAPGMDGVATNAAALKTALGNFPPTNIPVTAPGLPEVAADANTLKTAIDGITPAKSISVTAPGLPEIATDAQNATTAIDALPPGKTITIDAVGLDAGPYQAFGTAVSEAMNQALSAAQNMASGVASALQGAASGAYASGSALGSGFASGIQSQVGAVAAAAAALAEAASAPLPRSPAKTGPFSGKGWTPYRGKSLGVGFAQGISGTVGDIKSAAMGAAEAASGALNSATSAVAKTAGATSGGNSTTHSNGVTSGAGFGQAAKSGGGFGFFGGMLSGLLGGIGRAFSSIFGMFRPDIAKMGASASGLRKVHGEGKILSVLDKNKQVISRFHEKAGWDRQSGPGQAPVNNTNNNKSTGVENMNIYAGPGQDPYQLVEQAMFQVNVSSKGKY